MSKEISPISLAGLRSVRTDHKWDAGSPPGEFICYGTGPDEVESNKGACSVHLPWLWYGTQTFTYDLLNRGLHCACHVIDTVNFLIEFGDCFVSYLLVCFAK